MLASKFETDYIKSGLPFKIGVMDGAQSFVYHWHYLVEILYGLEKETVVGIENTHYRLKEQDILFIGQQETHCLFPSEASSKRLAVMFDPAAILGVVTDHSHMDIFQKVARYSGSWPSEAQVIVRNCLTNLYEEYCHKQPGWQEAVMSDLYRICLVALRMLPKEEMVKPEEATSLKNILNYLAKNYLKDITLQTCAKDLGFNASYLSNTFSRHTGTTFHQYLVSLRLNEAEILLRDSDAPIDVIAEKSGFVSVKTFYRVFQKKYGMSPSKFRKSVDALENI